MLELILLVLIIPIGTFPIVRTPRIGIVLIGISRTLRIDSWVLRIPKIPETELQGNAGQARIARILTIPYSNNSFMEKIYEF